LVVGAVLLLASVLKFEKKRVTAEFVLAVIGVLTVPYALVTAGWGYGLVSAIR
jgi:hypothetical protein